ncbi:MAG: hypothetical protein Q8N84_04540 [bacterium]|nr:hypothetical protein [bacterium]
MPDQPIKPTGCCDPFNPEPWQEKEITWANKLFVKDHVTSFLHIPLNMGQKIIKKMATLSGTFLTKVFEGPYQNVGKWAQEMGAYVQSKGKKLTKLYFSYTTCPKCAKAYGKNYVVIFAQVG